MFSSAWNSGVSTSFSARAAIFTPSSRQPFCTSSAISVEMQETADRDREKAPISVVMADERGRRNGAKQEAETTERHGKRIEPRSATNTVRVKGIRGDEGGCNKSNASGVKANGR
jgi:hypothetical protein